MGVSLTGVRGPSMRTIRLVATALAGVLTMVFYLYGPAIVPVMSAAAVSNCNELAGGNFRSYRLGWVVGVRPHWECWDLSAPDEDPVDLGWWVGRS